MELFFVWSGLVDLMICKDTTNAHIPESLDSGVFVLVAIALVFTTVHLRRKQKMLAEDRKDHF